MSFVKRDSKYDWRKYLTPDERAVLEEADEAKARWQELNKSRAGIQNRATARAIYDARRRAQP